MSKAYEQQFGAPICVADSYRTYERQQLVYAERPGYAATPGTSEMGWARAVDLCGGIQTDGTPQNAWMRLNAAQCNWFHPAGPTPAAALRTLALGFLRVSRGGTIARAHTSQ